MERFAVGELVYYNDQPSRPDIFSRQLGPGPYRVVKIDRAPDIANSGHAQWCYIEGYAHPISGAWFTHNNPIN